jgi:hypothetical protein
MQAISNGLRVSASVTNCRQVHSWSDAVPDDEADLVNDEFAALTSSPRLDNSISISANSSATFSDRR